MTSAADLQRLGFFPLGRGRGRGDLGPRAGLQVRRQLSRQATSPAEAGQIEGAAESLLLRPRLQQPPVFPRRSPRGHEPARVRPHGDRSRRALELGVAQQAGQIQPGPVLRLVPARGRDRDIFVRGSEDPGASALGP